jgi:glycosyltransferase involved in cell wall biosynthesis
MSSEAPPLRMTPSNKPLVSILMVSFNQRPYIEEALYSALEQRYENLQVVVSDDSSTDGTAETILKIAEKYPRLKAIVGGPQLGITGNFNRGLAACKGEFIAFQGGDDVLLPGKIDKQVAWFSQRDSRVLCGHDVEVFDSESGVAFLNSTRTSLTSGRGAAFLVKTSVPFVATSIMVRASAMPPSLFDMRIPTVSDWKFWIDCLAGGGEYGYVPGVLARYRRHPANFTRSFSQGWFDDIFFTLALVESVYPHLAVACQTGRAGKLYWKAAWHISRGEVAAARHYAAAALRPRLPSPKMMLLYLLTFMPDFVIRALAASRASSLKIS